MKKILSAVLVFIMALCLFACGEAEPKPNPNPNPDGGAGTVQDTFPYWNIEKNRKTDGQYYTESGVQFPDTLWQTPAAEHYATLDRGDIKAYFIDSVQNTKVFCYVGIPETASADNKVPAVVLVHGATGTAFYDWVKMWNDRGYAAIAMDTEGRVPTADGGLYHATAETSPKTHGPVNAAFNDCGNPIENQWVYHAIGSIIASASFIKSFEGVDGDRIGITGVSYGGFLTCLAAGYDDRFVFAAPVYGCIANMRGTGELGNYMRRNEGSEIWDGLGPLETTRAVVLMVNGNLDTHFSLESTTLCAKAAKQSALCIKNKFAHGHSEGADVNEVFAFADEICLGKTPMLRVTDVDAENGEVVCALPKGVTVKETTQYYSVSGDVTNQTVWGTEDAEEDSGSVFFSPGSYKYQYISITDSRGLITATPLLVRE